MSSVFTYCLGRGWHLSVGKVVYSPLPVQWNRRVKYIYRCVTRKSFKSSSFCSHGADEWFVRYSHKYCKHRHTTARSFDRLPVPSKTLLDIAVPGSVGGVGAEIQILRLSGGTRPAFPGPRMPGGTRWAQWIVAILEEWSLWNLQ